MYPFPTVHRVLSTNISHAPPSVKVAYYRIHTNRLPMNDTYELCMFSDNNAHMRVFHSKSLSDVFIAPDMKDISSIAFSPINCKTDISFIEIEKTSFHEETDTPVSTIHPFVPYYGTIHTDCLYVPEKPKELLYEDGIQSYTRQKNNTNKYTIGFLAGGAAIFQVTSGEHSAFVFVAGCTIGIIYQLLLQYEVDHVGKKMMFVNSVSRLVIVGIIASIMINKSDNIVPSDICIATTGFLMQKIAIWIAFM